MTDQVTEGYCLKCRVKVAVQDATPVFTETGRPATRGTCPNCGAVIFRMGATPAHEGLAKPAKAPRAGKLVIVESPAKARTVGRFLGKGYTVKASVGHVRDLLRSQLSVDVEKDFEPQYRVPNEKRAVVKEIKDEARKVEEIYLATDPDREGEAIAWHLMEAAEFDPQRTQRVVFHEITQNAIQEAFAHSRSLDDNLVAAQQARRILDRLVGYQISPLLWERVRNRTTAGRVQSVAVRLIVEREREIQAFVAVEYWSIEAQLAKQAGKRLEGRQPRSFVAKLLRINGQEVDLRNQPATQQVVDELQRSQYQVARVKRGERTRRPAPPFTTSTLQQESSRRLGFTAKRTMATAQALYEGISIGEGEGSIGLITYMRTDSLNIAEVAQEEARNFIGRTYGDAYLPKTPPKYKTKAKGAQEAHEAIRPTSVNRTPEMLEKRLTRDQFRLYQLIWNRFIASQMNPAIMDTISVDIGAGAAPAEPAYLFRVSGSSVRFPGFLAVYEETQDEDATASDEEAAVNLPPLEENEPLDLVKLMPEQHFTQPPPRYTEATLVRALEENGIGRPSTYAPIISTIQARGYVERVDRRLTPTQLGMVVNDILVKHFPDIVDVGFTAKMEEDLDRVAAGEMEWVPMLHEFYGPFAQELKLAEATMEKVQLDEGSTGEVCDKCGASMVIKFGRFGKFIACSNYPQCRNAKPYLERVGARCPQCGGDLVKRRTRKGRFFYGCANYPTCNFSTWKEPLKMPCPKCQGLLVVANKEYARCLQCENQVEMSQVEAEKEEA